MSHNDWPCILLYNHRLNKIISSERFGQNPNQLILTSGLVLGDWPPPWLNDLWEHEFDQNNLKCGLSGIWSDKFKLNIVLNPKKQYLSK